MFFLKETNLDHAKIWFRIGENRSIISQKEKAKYSVQMGQTSPGVF